MSKSIAVQVNGETICHVCTGSRISVEVARDLFREKINEICLDPQRIEKTEGDGWVNFVPYPMDAINPS